MPNDETERTWTAVPRLTLRDRRHAFFLVLAGPQAGEIFPLEPGRELIVGRREDADVPIQDDGISRRHAAVRVDGDRAAIRDLGSVNGTWVDGVRVEEAALVDGCRVAIGGATTLKFAYTDELEAQWQLKLAESALRDPLTGLSNRRHFEERLAAEIAAAQRHGRPVSVLLVDVDHFKSVNDGHGHLAGDEALKMVAAVLQDAVRREDVLARYGGEEFVVVARETELAGARALGERIRRAVERSRCAWQGQEIALTVSIGVTVSAGAAHPEAGRSERELLEAADRALYLAKQGGRNRVVALPVHHQPTR